jgi:acyl-homoserine-lactone acylase
VADDFASLGFGHGYATAEDNLCLLADTHHHRPRRALEALRADATYTDHVTLNATNLQTDVLFTNIRDRGVVEDLLADPDARTQRRGPRDGRGLHRRGEPLPRGLGGPDGIDDPCAGEPTGCSPPTLDLWHGIYAANLLASAGVFVPEIVEASPPTLDDPGLPLSRPGAGGFAPCPTRCPPPRSCASGWAWATTGSAPTAPRWAATPPTRAGAWCWATRTSRGRAATASPRRI